MTPKENMKLYRQEVIQKMNDHPNCSTEARSKRTKKQWADVSPEERVRKTKKMRKGLRKYYKNVDPEAKAAHFKKIHEKAKQYYANLTDEEKTALKINQSKARKAFYKTILGQEYREYQSYLMKFIDAHRTPKEKADLAKKMSKPRKFKKKPDKSVSMCRTKRRRRRRYIEENVPRKKTFCGVVTIEEFEEI